MCALHCPGTRYSGVARGDDTTGQASELRFYRTSCAAGFNFRFSRLSRNTLGALTGLRLCTQNSHSQAILRQPVRRTHIACRRRDDVSRPAKDELGRPWGKGTRPSRPPPNAASFRLSTSGRQGRPDVRHNGCRQTTIRINDGFSEHGVLGLHRVDRLFLNA